MTKERMGMKEVESVYANIYYNHQKESYVIGQPHLSLESAKKSIKRTDPNADYLETVKFPARPKEKMKK